MNSSCFFAVVLISCNGNSVCFRLSVCFDLQVYWAFTQKPSKRNCKIGQFNIINKESNSKDNMTLARRPTLRSGLPGYARFLIGQSNYDSHIKTDGRLIYWAELILQLKQTVNLHYHTLNSLSLFRLAESLPWIFESAPVRSSSCRLHNNHVRDTQGHGWSCHLWPRCMILRVIMPSTQALCY